MKKEVKALLVTRGLLITILFYLVILIMNHNSYFYAWDECSYWGMVKEMLRVDDFYTVSNSALTVHKDYPPIIPLFEMLWCKFRLGYGETYCLSALQFLSLSFFVPAMEKMIKSRCIKSIFITIFVSILVYAICYISALGFYFKTIYSDGILGILITYLLYSIYRFKFSDKFGLINLIVSLSFILLIKQMGTVFYVLTIFYLIIICLYKIHYVNKSSIRTIMNNQANKKRIISLFCLLMIPLLVSQCWNLYISQFDIAVQFRLSDIRILDFIHIIDGSGGLGWQQQAFSNYIFAILNIDIITYPLGLSYWQSICILMAILFVFGFFI